MELPGIIHFKDGFLKASPVPDDIQLFDKDIQLKVFLLNRLAQISKVDSNFSKQAHFLLIYEWALSENKKIIDHKRVSDVNDINQYFKEQGYQPFSVSGGNKRPIVMNSNKLHYWVILAEYLGLVRPGPIGRKSSALVHINDRMILAFIRLYIMREGGMNQSHPMTCSLAHFLSWSQTNFLFIPNTQEQYLPEAIVSSLVRLERNKAIKIGILGDSRSWTISNIDDINGPPKRINTIEVLI